MSKMPDAIVCTKCAQPVDNIVNHWQTIHLEEYIEGLKPQIKYKDVKHKQALYAEHRQTLRKDK